MNHIHSAPSSCIASASIIQKSLHHINNLLVPMHRYAAICLLLIFAIPLHVACGQASSSDEPVRGRNGMVVSAQVDASQAGLEVLQKGGNAIDAAVATGFALAVTYPAAGNIGGGGFMVIRFEDGSTTSFDYREKAPMAAHRDMFLNDAGEAVDSLSRRGHLASGVPGSVAGLLAAHEAYGRLPLQAVLNPAIRLAADGHRLSRRQAAQFNAFRSRFSEFEGTARHFTKPDASDYVEGEIFRQPELADVLRRIVRHGRDGFYRGETADLIVREMERGGGLITLADLEAYEPVERTPLTSTYRDHRVISMAPPSSGGIALAQLLNAVEPHDPGNLGYHSSALVHLMGEAMRRVYADRAEWLGDPDYYDVPVSELMDKAYMQQRMTDFDPDRAQSSDEVGHGDPLAYESMETTHYSVVDRWGNAVSTTTTINGSYGSYVVVDGAGFFLNNEMDDFSVKPGSPNMFGLVGTEANAIQPGKRMLSSMTPTILEDPQGRLFMVIGTPGGATIITTVFQVIMNVIDHGMDIMQAVSASRFHHQWLPDELRFERFALQPDVVANLEARGWNVVERRGVWGRADGIVVSYDEAYEEGESSGLETIRSETTGRIYLGGADPRGDDVAVGY